MLAELLRVFGLTAAVLVLVVAFGAAIKPLAAEDLVGPLQTAKYVMLAIVPMLQYALPFSAGFAATLVFHRMTNDNEVLAASAGGISYGRVLLPVAVLGLALLATMVLLTQWIVPRFWASMDRVVARDVTRLVQSSIAKGMPVRFGDVLIHADDLIVERDPPDTRAETRLVLFRVVAAQLDRDGRVVRDVSARQAVVDVHIRDGRTLLMLVLDDTVAFDGKSGKLLHGKEVRWPEPVEVPSPFQDNLMFMPQHRLLWLRAHPDEYRPVIAAKKELAKALREGEALRYIGERIAADGSVELADAAGAAVRTLVVEADRFEGDRFVAAPGRPVVVTDVRAGKPVLRISAESATVRRALRATLADPAIDLVLGKCAIVDPTVEEVVNEREELPIPGLSLEAIVGEDPSALPWQALVERARQPYGAEPGGEFLQGVVERLRRDSASRLMARYALSLTAMLLLLLGATLAMLLRHSVPLVVYVWAFLPSILGILMISGGDHVARSGLMAAGAGLLWSGNVIVLVVLVLAFVRLSRN
jgi:lipopolysaccharide export LptBFGC system permease protein LptF